MMQSVGPVLTNWMRNFQYNGTAMIRVRHLKMFHGVNQFAFDFEEHVHCVMFGGFQAPVILISLAMATGMLKMKGTLP